MQPLSPSQREALEEAVAAYEVPVVLGENEVAVEFLLARGVTPETAATFRLGVVEDPVPGHEKYRGMLAIPYLHPSGYPLSIRFRCLHSDEHDCRDNYHGKYMSMDEEPNRVFSVGSIFAADDEIHVTEGEFDAMILNQIGMPAVAIPGAAGWQGHHRRMLAGFSRVWVWGDPDEAGGKFTTAVTRSLGQAKGVRIKGGDVNEVYLQGGASALRELVEWERR